MEQIYSIPVIMTFTNSDPTGGSGIQADIETLYSLGCHCAAIITAISVCNTQSLKSYTPTVTSLVIEQARAILEDMPISAFKIGRTGSLENLAAIYTILQEHRDTPVVVHLDPLALGTIDNPDHEMSNAITSLLCQRTTILILDTDSAQILTPGADNTDACAQKLMDYGCEYVLIKNCKPINPTIQNLLYGNHRLLENYVWERIPGQYFGCGSTLSAAITSLLAHKLTITEAVAEAQKYTWDCIKQGYRAGMGSQLLNRLFHTNVK